MLNTATVTATLVPAGNEEIIRNAVTSREPDEHVAVEDTAWWLGLQERLEIRADLADHGLL
jgi:hypothetical protein